MNLDLYLERSPVLSDGGNEVGKLPGSVPLPTLRDLGHPESPVKAIRAKCLDCSGGSEAEARKCVAVRCPLWPFRMGSSPFRKPASAAQRDSAARASAARIASAGENHRNLRGLIQKLGHPATGVAGRAMSPQSSKPEGLA